MTRTPRSVGSLGGPRFVPNKWDVIAFPLIFGLLVVLGLTARQMAEPLSAVTAAPISLDPAALPGYALRTTLRMLAALACSLLFTFTIATWAAKSRRAEKVIVPVLDILQSVPILGYISFTVVFFMSLFPGSALGAECAAVFAIFTSQAWNMAFSFYQSLKTLPRDLVEVSRGFRLTAWQRFWTLEVPFGMPGLVWNMMMSMSGGWFFVVASESISVGDTTLALPGVGSYVAAAIAQRDLGAVAWAILAMLVVILLYDQLLFRPLVAWSEKFRVELTPSQTKSESWVLDLVARSRLLNTALGPIGDALAVVAKLPWRLRRGDPPAPSALMAEGGWIDRIWDLILIVLAAAAAWQVALFIATEIDLGELVAVLLKGLATLARVVILIALATVVWVPAGVWIGLRPAWAEKVQPVAQFMAAFPANLVFPVAVVAIVHWKLDPDIWLAPLMILGTQWYILFNVIAGVAVFPTDLREAAAHFQLGGWTWWRKVMLPGIFPYYVTGAITASGGSWNAAIVAEVASWGDDKLTAYGLGAYIAEATDAGDFPRIVLGIAVMSIFVILFNRLLWRPLLNFAERRLRLD
jgi:NitT/TauT family transport system permease protein